VKAVPTNTALNNIKKSILSREITMPQRRKAYSECFMNGSREKCYTERRMQRKVSHKRIGSLGEKIAAQFLSSSGHTILEMNRRWGGAEIDIITEKKGIIHLVEVKSISREKSSEDPKYRPEELVHKEKVSKIWRFGQHYLLSREMGSRSVQIDAVAVHIYREEKRATCELIEHVEAIL
jgi:putative endonuclease